LVSKELDIVLGAIDTSNSLLSWHWQHQPWGERHAPNQ
jgi:hypothetical protein